MPREPLEAIVLVGGQGTRLRPLTLSAPKPLLPTAGVPFLAHLLTRAAAGGVTHVVLATCYKAEMVAAVLEKTPEPVTNRINAGCYVFRREVIDQIPAGRRVSVERETFPGLIEAGARVMGYHESAYWLDVGTPQAFVRGSCDLVLGRLPGPAVPGPRGPALALADATVADDADVSGGTVVGVGASV